MMQYITKIRAMYIFYTIASLLLLGSFYIDTIYNKTKDSIEQIMITSNIKYIDDVTENIIALIKKKTEGNIYTSLKNNKKIRESIEQSLQFFITDRYKYLYVVDKESEASESFRFLLDGSLAIDEKSEFEESYVPLDVKAWNSLYSSKKVRYFKHKENKILWMTYLKPIIIKDKVVAIVVVDFSLETHNMILSSLHELDKAFQIATIFVIVIFIVIIGFSYMDRRREIVKDKLYYQLERANNILKKQAKELRQKSQKIVEFNESLKDKVKIEVDKNREKDKQLLQQSQLAQMGEMMSMIAHQWRQPLAAISSTSSAIKLKENLGTLSHEKTIELSDKISEYAQHLSATIDDFREFFKPNKERVDTSFVELIKSVLNIVEIAIHNKNIKIIEEINSTEKFSSFANELKQVILNLIKNAEDVLLENNIEDAYIKIATYKEGEYFILEVGDNGGGIPKDIIDKIFDPYFSTKTKKDGTGLGLYMSKTIVEEHCGGTLSVSNSSEGAIFKIVL